MSPSGLGPKWALAQNEPRPKQVPRVCPGSYKGEEGDTKRPLGGPPVIFQFSRFGGNCLENIFKGVLRQSSLPIWLPGTIEFFWGGMDSLESSPQNHSLKKLSFSGAPNRPKTSPGQSADLGVPKSDPGLQNLTPCMKKQKMRAKTPCRTPPWKNQTEPHGANYGRKPFW